MEISPSLFDIQESANVSKEKVNQLAQEIVKRYRDQVEAQRMKKEQVNEARK